MFSQPSVLFLLCLGVISLVEQKPHAKAEVGGLHKTAFVSVSSKVVLFTFD